MLKIGDKVTALWTNCNKFWKGKAVVTKVNDKSVLVVLMEDIAGHMGGYKAGHELKIPRKNTTGYSKNNRIVEE